MIYSHVDNKKIPLQNKLYEIFNKKKMDFLLN